MTVELARRLLDGGISPVALEAALLHAASHAIPLSAALLAQDPALLRLAEREQERAEPTALLTVRPSLELMRRLPNGMCERLMALPVYADPRSGRVDVAAVEPLDPHLQREFAFQLGLPVRVLRAPLEEVRHAFERMQSRRSIAPSTSRPSALRPSDAPIPLVRRSNAPNERTESTAPRPSAAERPRPARVKRPSSRPPSVAPDSGGEPVLNLIRSKHPPAALARAARSAQASESESPPTPRSSELPVADAVCSELMRARSPEHLLELLCAVFLPVSSVVFAVEPHAFEVRLASPSIEQALAGAALTLPRSPPSLLSSALSSGSYFGLVPETAVHEPLVRALTSCAEAEVYAARILVSGTPRLVWLLAGFAEAPDFRARVDDAARAAGRRLEGIVLGRKRGS